MANFAKSTVFKSYSMKTKQTTNMLIGFGLPRPGSARFMLREHIRSYTKGNLLYDFGPDSCRLFSQFGTVYFKKYASAFTKTTPQSHYNPSSVSEPEEHVPVKAQHMKWLIWDCTQFENNMLPSIEALYRHWTRAC